MEILRCCTHQTFLVILYVKEPLDSAESPFAVLAIF